MCHFRAILRWVLTWHSMPHYTSVMALSAIPSEKGEQMKTRLRLFLLASVATLAFAADNAPFSGKWQIHNNIAGNESDQACTFTQKGNELTGSCSSDQGVVNITGKVDEKKVTWTYKSEYNGSPITLNYQGSLDSATKIAGTVNVAEYGADGDFTATQSK
jgi:hypothetical protein